MVKPLITLPIVYTMRDFGSGKDIVHPGKRVCAEVGPKQVADAADGNAKGPSAAFVGLTSRKGSERTLAALQHNEMNQMVVGRPKFRPLSEQWTANAVSEIRRLLVLGVLKNPKIEVTPRCTRRRAD